MTASSNLARSKRLAVIEAATVLTMNGDSSLHTAAFEAAARATFASTENARPTYVRSLFQLTHMLTPSHPTCSAANSTSLTLLSQVNFVLSCLPPDCFLF